MKFLIWFLCLLTNAIITTLLRNAGITLGGIPTALLFAATFWLAKTLCKKWDEHKESKKRETKSTVLRQQSPVMSAAQVRFCRKCGEKLIDNSQYCRKCGTEIIEV